ncbi:MAG TPA: hypothetical protein VE567_05790, partial [Sphingomonas sp.]|nr:hypothetical protein [Sphingomonas sp.]
YKPPAPQPVRLPGATGETALGLAIGELVRQGKATKHDAVVAGALARMEHTLETGKPLRN